MDGAKIAPRFVWMRVRLLPGLPAIAPFTEAVDFDVTLAGAMGYGVHSALWPVPQRWRTRSDLHGS